VGIFSTRNQAANDLAAYLLKSKDHGDQFTGKNEGKELRTDATTSIASKMEQKNPHNGWRRSRDRKKGKKKRRACCTDGPLEMEATYNRGRSAEAQERGGKRKEDEWGRNLLSSNLLKNHKS